MAGFSESQLLSESSILAAGLADTVSSVHYKQRNVCATF